MINYLRDKDMFKIFEDIISPDNFKLSYLGTSSYKYEIWTDFI